MKLKSVYKSLVGLHIKYRASQKKLSNRLLRLAWRVFYKDDFVLARKVFQFLVVTQIDLYTVEKALLGLYYCASKERKPQETCNLFERIKIFRSKNNLETSVTNQREFHFLYADALYRLKDYKGALAYYRKVYSFFIQDNLSFDSLLSISCCCALLGDINKALENLELLSRKPISKFLEQQVLELKKEFTKDSDSKEPK